MKAQNSFGHMSAEYSAARRGYPTEVYEYLLESVGVKSPRTLDIGCGTGISTRELQQNGFQVVGADKETQMIDAARAQSPEIEYVVAPADNLPFESDSFDLITAFTAFHWFNDENSLTEIRRVLKGGGHFFAALKGNRESEESGTFRTGYKAIMKNMREKNMTERKNISAQKLWNPSSGICEKNLFILTRSTRWKTH